MKQRHPFRRDIILVIVLVLLILVAIIFPRFKELRKPVTETEIIYMAPQSKLDSDLKLKEQTPEINMTPSLISMGEKPKAPDLHSDTIDFEMPVLDTFDILSNKAMEELSPKPGPPPPTKSVIWNSGHPWYRKPELIGGIDAFYNNLVYPQSEFSEKSDMSTLVKIYIETDSCVHKTKIIKSSGSAFLDKIAEDALLKTRWVPARQKRPIAIWIAFPVKFELNK